MKKSKKVSGMIAAFGAVILLFTILTPYSWGQGLDLELSNYSSSKSSISVGDGFTLTMTIENNSDEPLTDLYLIIDTDSFFVRNQGSQITIDPSTLAAGDEVTITLNMVYSGGSGQIPLIFKYHQASEESEQQVRHTIGMVIEDDEEEEDEEEDTEITTNKAPIIRIADKKTQQIAAGSELKTQLQVKNLSSNSAKEVLMSLSFEDATAPFTFMGEQSFYLNSIGSQSSKSMELHLKADNTAKAGSYPLNIDYQYINTYGDPFTSSETLYLKVTAGKASPRLVFNPQGGQGLKAGEPYTLVLEVVNRGGLKAKDINMDLTGLSNEGIVLKSGGSRQYINELAAGSEANVSYEIQPGSKVKDGSFPLTITVSFKDESGTDYSDTQDVFVSVGKGGSMNGAPKIIVSRYQSDPVIVRAGENFILSMDFLNTHGSKTVHNIKVILNVTDSSSETGSVFAPVNASNTFYIDEISPQQAVSRSLELYTIPDASPKTYTIDAALEYDDDEGNEYKTNELIGIPVKQVNRLDVGDIQVYGEGVIGQPLQISCEFYNTGRVTLRNLMVKMEGDFEVDGAAAFIGNLEEGTMEYFDGTIIPGKTGALTGHLIFSYEDQSGEMQTIDKEFTVEVIESGAMEFPEGEVPGDMDGGLVFKPWYAVIPVVVIAAAVYFLIRRRKIKKEEEMIFDD